LRVEHQIAHSTVDSANPRFFFLPSLLGQNKPCDDVWDYKNNETLKETVCHSILIRDSTPPGLMERIIASILSEIHKIKPCNTTHLCIQKIHCWQKTLILSTTLSVTDDSGKTRRSKVELFVHLAEKDDKFCVASEKMEIGTRRIIICGKGHALDIWKGGYGIVKRAVDDVFHDYRGLDYEEQGICPVCLSQKAIGEACVWDWSLITSFTQEGHDFRCSEGHTINKRSLCLISNQKMPKLSYVHPDNGSELNVKDYLPKVVLIGLWDGDKCSNRIKHLGSGFIVDKRKGLIMTAAHVLINIKCEKNFGKDYFGIERGKVVIGVIPDGGNDGTQVVFRYFAKIVAKDRKMEGVEKCCQIDACVLQITSRMECDVDGNGDKCGEQEEHGIMDSKDMRNEDLKEMKILKGNCEINQPVHFIGFNQGGEGLRAAGEAINKNLDFTKGYVFAPKIESNGTTIPYMQLPVAETVVYSHLIVGHSGGPCINQEGKVIGMVSRSDPFEEQRCYLVPCVDLRNLLRKARLIA